MTLATLPLADQLPTLTITQLTSLYNELTGASLKKFQDKPTALKKVAPALEAERLRRRADAEAYGKAPPAQPKVRAPGLSGQIQALIREGFTNDAILTKLGLHDDAKRRSYPAWNRAMLRRTGQLVEAK